MSSTSDRISGKANQVVGTATSNEKVKAKGDVQETKGNLKDKLKDAGTVVSNKIDEIAGKTDR